MDAGAVTERWWRVEINKGGSIASCEAVETVHRNTRTVLYIRAICRDDALEEATRWLEKRRASQRAYEKRRRVERKKRGLCIACSNKISKRSSEFCATHLRQRRDYQRARKVEGPRPTPPQTNPLETFERITARHARYRRMTVQLPIVLAVFDQVDGRIASPFRVWLVGEIAARGGRTEAAAE